MNRLPPVDGPRTNSANWFDRGLLIATVLTTAMAMSPNLADPDLWGHVQYGQDLLRDGVPPNTTYSYSVTDYRWINHENLAELALAVGAQTIGPLGMLLAKCLLGLGVIGLIIAEARRGRVELFGVCIVALLVAVNLSYFWSMRPQLASFVLYALLLALLRWCFFGWEGRCWIARLDSCEEGVALSYSRSRLRALWLAPLLFCVWANAHGGFVAGFCIFTMYLVLRSVEAWATSQRELRRLIFHFGCVAAVSGIATLANPYGVQLHAWLLNSLGSPRPEILEWHAPDLTSTLMLPFWLMMVSWFALLLLTRRSRDITHTAILALTLWQALQHVRHLPFFAIAFGFWMAPHVESVIRRWRESGSPESTLADLTPRMRNAFLATLSLAFVLIGYQLAQRFSTLEVPRSEYPVDAFQYIADQDLRGRMVVTFNWAQYAIASFGAEHSDDDGIQVSFDGRFRTCYPQEVVDMNFDFVLGTLVPRFRGPDSPPFDDERVLHFGNPNLVLVARHQPHSVNVMFRNRQRREWVLLYQDKIAQLWGRASMYDDATSGNYIPADLRQITEDEQEGSVAWPAFPQLQQQQQLLAASSVAGGE